MPISRNMHIYDLYQLMKYVDLKSLDSLVCSVRQDRSLNRMCLSAQPDIEVSEVLNKIVESNFFKKDYEDITLALLKTKVSYDEAIEAIKDLSEGNLFK